MRLLCAISHHGLGHLAQTAPILHALNARRPGLEWVIWSGLPHDVLEKTLAFPFIHRHDATDVGLLMHDAVRVDVESSRIALAAFHHNWPERIRHEAHWLQQSGIKGVLSNVGYLPLAAAQAVHLPSVACCCLNWFDIARDCLGGPPAQVPLLAEIQAAYRDSRAFLRITPALPMPWLKRCEDTPPLALLGQTRRDVLATQSPTWHKRVLFGFGGVAYHSTQRPPPLNGITWIVPDAWADPARPDLLGYAQTGLPFRDLLASSDALVCKVSYGSFVEAAGLGLPVLYLDRPGWPETPWLTAWLHRHARAAALDEQTLFTPAVGEALAHLWHMPPMPAADVSGASQAARRILEILEVL